MANRQFRLARRPTGRVERSNFELTIGEVPAANDGQIVVQTLYLSLDPTNRVWMEDVEQYLPPVQIGEVMRGIALGRVVETKHAGYAVGDLVIGMLGWQDYAVLTPDGARNAFKVPPGLPFPQPAFLSALGFTGITAYHGIMDIGKPVPGETVVISAAAGAVGSVAGQLVKIAGARAVGIAGSREKCAWLTSELGYDAAVCYRDEDWREQLARACPNGIDVNFENVGGDIMNAVIAKMNLRGRVVLCGLISGYNDGKRALGPYDTILMKRLRVEGFIIIDYERHYPAAIMKLGQWLMEGKLKSRETIVDGLESAPDALNMLFDGGNTGKLLVQVAT